MCFLKRRKTKEKDKVERIMLSFHKEGYATVHIPLHDFFLTKIAEDTTLRCVRITSVSRSKQYVLIEDYHTWKRQWVNKNDLYFVDYLNQ